MPIDINVLRREPEKVRESQRRRFKSVELVDQIIASDEEWRTLISKGDFLRKDRNKVQKEVAEFKKRKEECDDLVKRIREFDEEIKQVEENCEMKKIEVNKQLNLIGNIVDDSVPVSKDEKENFVVSRFGPLPTGNYLHHHDLLWRIGGYDPERGVQVAGHRAYFLTDAGVLLNQALINYGINFLRKRQYRLLQPPYFMNKDVMAGVAQLEQFDDELYKVIGEDEKYLIATSEQPICGFHKNEWLMPSELPKRYAGLSTCFRREAGSHGKDTWGIFRVHQFEKVEQFLICEGDLEASQALQEEMRQCAEEFYQSLGLSYQVVNIVSGELNNAAIRKYDLEAWFPAYGEFRELVSSSNCTDYQSRSMEIRCGNKTMDQKDKKYVHMLNATLCATTRTICCILENYQNLSGEPGVRVPEVLVPFMGGMTFLPFINDSRFAGKQDEKKVLNRPQNLNQTKTVPQVQTQPTAQAQVQVTAPVGETDKVGQLTASIAAAGELVRTLKASGGDSKKAIEDLLALKKEYKEITGEDFGGVAPKKTKEEKKDSKKETKKEEKKEEKKESKREEKPVEHVKAKETAVKQVANNDYSKLDEVLLNQSYLNGFVPSRNDAAKYNEIKNNKSNFADYPNLLRWFGHIESFAENERLRWV